MRRIHPFVLVLVLCLVFLTAGIFLGYKIFKCEDVLNLDVAVPDSLKKDEFVVDAQRDSADVETLDSLQIGDEFFTIDELKQDSTIDFPKGDPNLISDRDSLEAYIAELQKAIAAEMDSIRIIRETYSVDREFADLEIHTQSLSGQHKEPLVLGSIDFEGWYQARRKPIVERQFNLQLKLITWENRVLDIGVYSYVGYSFANGEYKNGLIAIGAREVAWPLVKRVWKWTPLGRRWSLTNEATIMHDFYSSDVSLQQ